MISLWDAPFWRRLYYWLDREPIRLVDPINGAGVARTRALLSLARHVTLSHDGSRMAVFNDEGVYIYDVPPEFR